MSAANSNSERVHQPLPPPPLPLLPPLTINDNEYKNSKKKTKTKKRLVVDIDIGRSGIDVNIDKEKEKESLILVRDPPREWLARSRGPLVSADEGVHEEQLLARVAAGKQDVWYSHDHTVLGPTSTSTCASPSSSFGTGSACTTPCTTTTTTRASTPAHRPPSQAEEFYADIYQYYYDVTKPSSPSPSPSPPPSSGRDDPSPSPSTSTFRPAQRPRPPVPIPTPIPIETPHPPSQAMSKKRGSLQAIFVPSFLQSAITSTSTSNSTTTTPPLTPAEVSTPVSPPPTPGLGNGHGTAKYASRIRALSAAGHASKAHANAHANANASASASGEPHQRKRSMTFSMSLSMSSSLHAASSSFSAAPYIAPSDGASATPRSPTTPTIPTTAATPHTHTHAAVPSPRSSPPPAFLIDDDPFANLTSAPSESMGLGGGGGVGRFHHPPQAQAPVVVPLPPLPAPIPRSPLYETPVLQPLQVVGAVGGAAALGSSSSLSAALVASDATVVASTSSSSTSTSTSTSTISPFASTSTSIAPITSTSSLLKSPSSSSLSLSASLPKPPSLSAPSSPPAPPPPTSQRPRAPAAHQRPAFSSRPSLPSLDTLARMNIVLTKKVRKGRVGAGLPFEPWDLPSDDEGTLSPPAPLPSSAATSTSASTSASASNVTAVRHTPAMAATTLGGGNINANASNTNANTNAGQNSSQNYHPFTSTSTSTSTSVITPAPVVSSSVSILSLSLSSLLPPPPPSSFSTISSPLPSPPLPLSPALSRSASPSPSPSHLQHSPLFPLPSSPSPSTSSVTSTSSTTRSSASSTPPATATTSTFASAPTSGYVPHPHPPLPPPPALHSSMQAPTQSPVPTLVQIARPQPLLPSQILALGSIAAEVEMVVPVLAPVPGPSYIPAPAPAPVRNETAGRVGVSEGFEYAWTKPASVSVSVARTSSYAHSPAPPPPIMGSLPVVQEMEAAGLHVDVDADVMEEEEPDGYFEDFLDRYQRPSRAGSEDDHGLGFGYGVEPEPEPEARVRERKEYVGVDVGGVVNELAGQDGDAGGASREDASETIGAVVGAERDSFAEEYSYLYASGKLGDDGADAEGDGESTAGLSSCSRSGPGVAAAARFDSAVFSTPPSSASLSRSFSLRSDSSVGSADSAGAVEHAGGREGEEMWSYRRFAAPSRSLSSLELDLEGEGEGEGAQGMSTESGYDVHSTEGELRRRGDSTRSSSSHPSLSRTRSSSDDSDVLQSPTPGDHDYSFFPYSHARTLAQIYQSSAGYSALFAPPVVSESFHYGPAGHGLSSSSSVEEVRGGAGAGWGGAFIAEPERGISIPEGLAADTDGDGGFGFGFDKVIVAVEDQDDVVEVKEKASLATTTSIDTVQPTSTALKEREADSLQSPPSSFPCNQHDLSLSASPNLSFVESGISPLVSESDSITQPTSLTSDDEMISRSNVMASGVPVRFRTTTTRPWTSGQPGDSTGYRSRGHSTTSSTSQPYRAGSSHAQTANNNASNSSYYSMGSRDHRSGRRRGDSDDEDGEEERRRRRALERMYANDGVAKIASSSSSDEDDIGADNYGKPSTSSSKNRLAPRGTAAGSAISRSPSITGSFVTASSRSPSLKLMDFPASSKHSSSYVTEDEREEEDSSDDDDDVPLAQRIPGALTAQKTIRRQFREEREQRKREKALRMENGNAERRARQETLRPAGAGVSLHDGNGAAADSSSRDAAMHAASSVNALRRQRTTTLPGKSPTSATFNPHDLARKLQNVQLAEVSMPAYQQQQYLLQQQQQLALRQRSKSISRTSADHQQSFSPHSAASASASSPATRNRSIKDPSSQSQRQFPPASPNSQTHVPPVSSLRPMRSFHPPPEHRSVGVDDPRFKPLPADAEQRLGRSVTSATRSHRPAAMDDPRSGALPADAEHRLGRSATSATRNPHRRSPSQSRPSGDRGERSMEPVPPLPTNMHSRTSNDDPRKIHKVPNTTEPRISSTRTSGDVERAPRNASVQPPLPPLANKVVVSQQRVFVGNLQQFHMVEIGPITTAGDVVTMMEAEGALTGWAGSGGWMVFEIAQDFGMERPVRSYELLADVQSSWLKDKSVNYFVLKLSPLAIPLSRNAIPTSSPTHSGYIEWEAKRGKWSKRWLQLREHNLYLAKRDNGKDEVLICSLSNFDAYTITRAHRCPKPFAFAIKSTDNLSFFENTADYLHTFSCSEKDGKIWMEKILVARSYVLHQERHILFNPKPTSNGGAAVTRAGTKKYAPIRSAQQPLVSLPPIGVAQSLPHHDVFEPGSLLAKH